MLFVYNGSQETALVSVVFLFLAGVHLAILLPLYHILILRAEIINLFDGALIACEFGKTRVDEATRLAGVVETKVLASEHGYVLGAESQNTATVLYRIYPLSLGELLSSLSEFDLVSLHVLLGKKWRMIISSLALEVSPEFRDQVWGVKVNYETTARVQGTLARIAVLGDNFFTQANAEQRALLASSYSDNEPRLVEMISCSFLGGTALLAVSEYKIFGIVLIAVSLIAISPVLIRLLYPKIRPHFLRG